MKTSGRRSRKSKSKRRDSIFVDRADQYVDSPLITHRIRFKKSLFANIQGNYGVYRTWVHMGSRSRESGCTCPSDWWPCKHVSALERTWRENPGSFFDVDGFLKTLASRRKAELIESIGKLISRAPEGLSALGVKEFEGDEIDEMEDEDDRC